VPSFGQRLRLIGKAAVGTFDEASAKRAFGLLSGVLPGGLGPPPVRGTKEYLRAYSEMPWLRAVASRIATAVSSTEWQLFVRGKSGERARRDWAMQRAQNPVRRKALRQQAMNMGDLREIEDHPLLDVLNDANSLQTGAQMRKVTQLHLDLVGESFWLKERDALGMVVAVWPIPPDWVINTPTPINKFFRVQFRSWRGLIPDTEILWFSEPDPANPYGRGSGTAQALGDELETDEFVAKHTKAFFYNRARPDLLVWPKQGTLRQENVDRLEESWLQSSQGFWKAFKPYFLSREVGVQTLDQNFRALMLVQLREFERIAIIQQFGIPPELLGVLENSNRATIEAADYLFSRYVIQPRLEFLRAVMQERLVPEFDERLILDYVNPVSEDKEHHLKAAQAAPWSINVDEWRELQGREPLDDKKGEVHIFPTGVREHTMGEEDPMPVGFDPETGRPFAPFDPDASGKPGNKPPADDDEKAFQEWRALSRRLTGEDAD
jgi:HK97 family phage portal protein